jgi:hypothetical protein
VGSKELPQTLQPPRTPCRHEFGELPVLLGRPFQQVTNLSSSRFGMGRLLYEIDRPCRCTPDEKLRPPAVLAEQNPAVLAEQNPAVLAEQNPAVLAGQNDEWAEGRRYVGLDLLAVTTGRQCGSKSEVFN